MANKLQQAAARQKVKHVSPDEANLWLDHGADVKDLTDLKRLVGLLFMGMRDLRKWMSECEEAVNGFDDKTEDHVLGQLRLVTMRIETLEKHKETIDNLLKEE